MSSTADLEGALQLKRAGKFDEAVIALEEILGRSASNVLALTQLADVQLRRHKTTEAAEALDRAEAAGGTTAFTARIRGDLRYRERRWREAAACFRDAAVPGDRGIRSLLQLARCHLHLGELDAGALVSVEAIDAVSAAARRLLGVADTAFRDHQRAGFAGSLRIWEVGRIVLQPLLATHGRVAVLMVDAMRADLWNRLHDDVASALAGRTLRQRWAVVPEPTRTTEAVAALYLGRAVPPGAGPVSPADLGLPFAHLGYESAALVGVDRPYAAGALRELWAAGPKISVAVATSVDEMLHRSSLELAGLLDEAVAGLQRRVLPTLAALPAAVPLVVLADHGFRESPSWGQSSRTRWTHGGLSLEECVVPVAVFGPCAGSVAEVW